MLSNKKTNKEHLRAYSLQINKSNDYRTLIYKTKH